MRCAFSYWLKMGSVRLEVRRREFALFPIGCFELVVKSYKCPVKIIYLVLKIQKINYLYIYCKYLKQLFYCLQPCSGNAINQKFCCLQRFAGG